MHGFHKTHTYVSDNGNYPQLILHVHVLNLILLDQIDPPMLTVITIVNLVILIKLVM